MVTLRVDRVDFLMRFHSAKLPLAWCSVVSIKQAHYLSKYGCPCIPQSVDRCDVSRMCYVCVQTKKVPCHQMLTWRAARAVLSGSDMMRHDAQTSNHALAAYTTLSLLWHSDLPETGPPRCSDIQSVLESLCMQ